MAAFLAVCVDTRGLNLKERWHAVSARLPSGLSLPRMDAPTTPTTLGRTWAWHPLGVPGPPQRSCLWPWLELLPLERASSNTAGLARLSASSGEAVHSAHPFWPSSNLSSYPSPLLTWDPCSSLASSRCSSLTAVLEVQLCQSYDWTVVCLH